MKKVITLALAAVIVTLGLASCKGNDKDKDAATTPSDTTTAVATTEADTTAAETTGDTTAPDTVGYETSAADGKVAFSSDYGFTVTYDGKYDSLVEISDGLIAVNSEDGDSKFVVNCRKYSELGYTREEFRSTLRERLETVYRSVDENFEFSKYEDTKLDEEDAAVMEYSIIGSEFHEVYVFGDEMAFSFSIYSPDMDSKFAQDMLAVIASVRFD